MTHHTTLWALRARLAQRPGPRAARQILLMSLLAVTAGCATTKTAEVHQFAPVPRVEVAGKTELGPVSTRPVSQILREAEQAYEAANAAQKQGNRPEAMRHYKTMLARLAEAEIDPSVFHSLRNQLNQIDDAPKAPQAHPIAGLSGGGRYNDIQVPFPLPERVLIEIDEIMNLYPGGFQAGLNRAQKYMPYIRSELKKAGLPEELGWLCMVESQFAPKIDSPAGAGGMWQFMPATARRYQLRVDNYVDERYNWVSATRSAIAMLSYLHDYFDGDWALAIAAYNMGEGGMKRAIEANGGQADYWKLIETPPASDRIKRETKKYYPRFLASVIVANNPQRYGFSVTPAQPEMPVRVPAKAMYALSDLDKSMGLPPGTLAKYNPDLIAEVTPPSGDYAISVPPDLQPKLVAALQSTSPTNRAPKVAPRDNVTVMAKEVHHYRVKRGETLTRIAAKYQVTPQEIMAANDMRSPHSLHAGQALKIPAKGKDGAKGGRDVELTTASRGTVTAAATPAAKEVYTVNRGDTLHAIATRNGCTVEQLQQWNNLGKKTDIAVGQKLVLAKGGSSDAGRVTPQEETRELEKATGITATHVVESGEYPAKIARDYGMSLNEFLAMNDMTSDSTIREGQQVQVLTRKGADVKSAKSGKPRQAEPVVHTVAKGETVARIAARYNVKVEDVLAWNGLTSKSVLRIGQQCKVYPNGGGAAKTASSGNKKENVKVAEAASKTHVVAKGHNPTSIARQYGVSVADLYKWNGWDRNHVLKVGDQVKVSN